MNACPLTPKFIFLIPPNSYFAYRVNAIEGRQPIYKFISHNGHSARSYAKCLIPISNHDSLLISLVETENCRAVSRLHDPHVRASSQCNIRFVRANDNALILPITVQELS